MEMEPLVSASKLSAFRAHLEPTSLSIPEALENAALSFLDQNDFPTTRQEAWKYTRVGKIAAILAETNDTLDVSIENLPVIDAEAFTIHIVNGHIWLPSTECPKGLSIQKLSDYSVEACTHLFDSWASEHELDVFSSLNTAYLQDGIVLKIDSNVVIDQPIQLIHSNTVSNQVTNVRHFIHAGSGSKAAVILGMLSSNEQPAFTNGILHVNVEANATLTIDKIQSEAAGNCAITSELVKQGSGSTFTINTVTLNGTLVRNNLTVLVNGTQCSTNMNGAYLLKDKQHVDNHTVVDHRQPHCVSNELYKGVMDEQSTAVFNGKVYVREHAQKINAFQSNGNVLLSDSATINSKPELEIYADDVKCSHGSTTGQLDEEAVFYLRARGLSESSARQLLVGAFIGDVIEKVENEAVREFIHDQLTTRFGWQLV